VDPHQWQGCHQPGARFVTTPKPGRGPYLGKSGPTGSPSSTGTSADGPPAGRPANLFRATQTEEKLRRDHIKGKTQANQAHFEVGRKVRQTIAELGGTMPEEQPTPEKSIQQLEKAQKQLTAGKKQKGGKTS